MYRKVYVHHWYFDNNDFREQTMSDKGTTFNTIGIAIQHDKLNQPMPSENIPTTSTVKSDVKKFLPKALPWPPNASDLTVDAACKIIPAKLYNFVAWMIGASDEPQWREVCWCERGREMQDPEHHPWYGLPSLKRKKSMPKHVACVWQSDIWVCPAYRAT